MPDLPADAPLTERARRVRRFAVEATARTRASHIGSALSATDLLVAVHFAAMRADVTGPLGDHCILSKGHAAVALYGVLAQRGILSDADLDHFYENGSLLAGHPEPNPAIGIVFGSGSLGHGLPVANGLALGKRMSGAAGHTWVIMSDGECEEGSTWEAAMFAARHHLARLTAIVDRNGIQGMGDTDSIMALEPLAEKWRAFGWRTVEVDGHDYDALRAVLAHSAASEGQPTAVIARTTKGRGVSFMEGNNDWHYRSANPDELARALAELDAVEV
jgi:transketolase